MVPHADDDHVRITSTWFGQADEILLGRSTYDMMRGYWSRVTDPGNPIATALNTLAIRQTRPGRELVDPPAR